MMKQRVSSWEFKERGARRMLNGENVSALHHKLQIKRNLLFRWRDAYRREEAAGFQRSKGRPSGVRNRLRPAADPGEAAARRIAELERKVGQQALDLDFFR